ncbi:MAG: glycine oxidase ThiO [Kangiellaceae bacterium]|nr:glycine oxidase ThiO [Kangiellaceae bacterium]
MPNQLKIGIVGAGIMGRLLAWQLSNAGHQITIFDKDPIEFGNAAAYTAAGMLTPYSEVESAEMLIFQMGMRSLELWPGIAKRLGSDLGFYQKGSLIVSHVNDRADLLRFNQQLNFKFNDFNLAEYADKPRQIDRSQLSQLEPEIASHFSEATYLPQESWLCTKCVMRSLADQLLERRVAWYAHSEITELGENFVQLNKQRFDFNWVIDCRGLGAKRDINELRGVRGEVILLEAPDVKVSRLVRLMHPRYRLYVVPKGIDNLYTIGATQIESDDDGPISVRSALELLSAAYSLHPGFAEAKILETKTNCRPALIDNLPRVDISQGLIRVNGLYRHGFLLAPTIAAEIEKAISFAGNYASPFEALFRSFEVEECA